MDKIALIGDTHFNRKAENPTIKRLIKAGQAAFFDLLVSDLRQRGITTIIFSGDIFDTRNSINVEAMVTAKRLFETKLSEFTIHIILGNHDMYYEDSYDITSLELIEHLPNVTVYREKVTQINIMGKEWLMFPWIVDNNIQKTVNYLNSESKKPRSAQKIIFGHFTCMGIDMEGGNISTFGLQPHSFMSASPLTISGHYHGKSITTSSDGDSKLIYLGSPYAMTFANSDQSHGYWIMDSDCNLEFIENVISPRFTTIRDTDNLDELGDLSNSFVRFYLNNARPRDELFELRSKLEAKRPLIIKPIPYKNVVINDGDGDREINASGDKASNLLSMDTLGLSSVYMDANHEDLPELKLNDARASIINKLNQYNETLNLKK